MYRLDATLYISDCIFQIPWCPAPDIVKTIIFLSHSFTIFSFRLLHELYHYFIVDWLSICVPVCTNKDNNNNNPELCIAASGTSSGAFNGASYASPVTQMVPS